MCSVDSLSLFKMVQTKNSFVKQFWLNKTPKQKYEFLHKVTDYYSSRLVGINTFSHCRIDWKSFYSGVLFLTYYILLSYTILYHICSNQFEKSFYSLCILGVVISVSRNHFYLFDRALWRILEIFTFILHQSTSSYLITISKNRFILNKLCKIGTDYIYKNEYEWCEYNRICSRSIDKTAKRYCITLAMIIVSMGITIFGPSYEYSKTSL